MKKILVVAILMLAVLTVNCQKKDQTFDVTVRFNQGIQFGDGTIMNTAATGVGVVTWDAITGKPLTFAPAVHNHDALYRGITWVPSFAQITGKPTTLAGYGITDASSIIHTHSLMYKPIDYVPAWNDVLGKPLFSAVATTGSFNDLRDVPEFIEIEEALPLLDGIKLPVMTQAEINALTPVKGLLLFNDTEGCLQVYTGTTWKVLIGSL